MVAEAWALDPSKTIMVSGAPASVPFQHRASPIALVELERMVRQQVDERRGRVEEAERLPCERDTTTNKDAATRSLSSVATMTTTHTWATTMTWTMTAVRGHCLLLGLFTYMK